MPAKLGILFLGVTVGGATFLVAGFALFLTIAQLQYSTLQARNAQAFEGTQVSTKAKNAPAMADANETEARYELVSNAPLAGHHFSQAGRPGNCRACWPFPSS